MVRRLSAPAPPTVPELKLPGVVDLGVYDRLLVGGAPMEVSSKGV